MYVQSLHSLRISFQKLYVQYIPILKIPICKVQSIKHLFPSYSHLSTGSLLLLSPMWLMFFLMEFSSNYHFFYHQIQPMSTAYTLNNKTCIILSNGNVGWVVQRFVFKTLCSQFIGKITNS